VFRTNAISKSTDKTIFTLIVHITIPFSFTTRVFFGATCPVIQTLFVSTAIIRPCGSRGCSGCSSGSGCGCCCCRSFFTTICIYLVLRTNTVGYSTDKTIGTVFVQITIPFSFLTRIFFSATCPVI